jgi:hypothetical protein
MIAPAVSTQDLPAQAIQKEFAYDSEGRQEYIGYAAPVQPIYEWSIGNSRLTSIVVSANVGTVNFSSAHGLNVGARVAFSGATVDTDLNGSYVVVSIPDATSLTVATVSVGNATYTDATLSVTTSCPRTNDLCWAIMRIFYNSLGQQSRITWAEGTTGARFAWNLVSGYAYF